ncbi:TPA: hypothetical protein HA361_06105 [Candidatus Woesearchaeota archaeon]|nr:hypothetical protein [Candidatus Woesearchaeota archaeon]HII69424.1 hypothetical protein [Candidatus Woesearchaeota archaeon]
MFIEILLALLLGICAGIFTGMVPGVHINLVAVLVVSASPFLFAITQPLAVGVFIIALAVTHTFIDSIPSIFLGAPDPDMALAALPGHRMLLEGKGYEAVKLTVIGSLLSLIATIAIMPLVIPFLPGVYDIIQPYIAHLLIVVTIYMILKASTIAKQVWGAIVFLLSGTLGLIVLSLHTVSQPLLPLLSGLFGISTLLLSLNSNSTIPKQSISETLKLPKKDTLKAVGAATLWGSITGLLPGLGSAQAAIIAIQFAGDLGVYGFLILIGGINTVNFAFSLAAYFTLDKARNGAIVAVMQLLDAITPQELMVFCAAALVAGGVAAVLALQISKGAAQLMSRLNYRMLVLSVIAFVSCLVAYFSGWLGILIMLTSTAVGVVPNIVETKRSLSMGCLVLPVILFFLL